MKSHEFLQLIKNVLVKKASLTPFYSNTPTVYVFVISPRMPFIVKGFKVGWHKEMWFQNIFKK